MKFDTIIIGGGLSGLVAGIRLSGRGQRCVIISSGQSSLHFSSGSFDLLNALPDGEEVTNPLLSAGKLEKLAPSHPYVKLGMDNFRKLAGEAEKFFENIKIKMHGSADENHYRITPMGTMKPAWLTLDGFAVCESGSRLPWKKVSIFNVAGFLDFFPRFIADEFKKNNDTESEIHDFDLPDLKYIRRNPSEMRAPNIARMLDKGPNIRKLANMLKEKSGNCDAIIIPAVIGLYDNEAMAYLRRLVGKPVFMVSSLPPSAPGINLQKYLHDYFKKLGGIYMLGDTVQMAEIEDCRVTKIFSNNHGDIPFTGENVILASGSYFSQGLIAGQDRVYEPIFDLDVSYAKNRQEWYNDNMFESQGYQQFGVKTDNDFNALYNGVPIKNLYVSGAVLEGFNPIKEGCGAGVSILSALHIADNLCK